jgi:hypothetical protein
MRQEKQIIPALEEGARAFLRDVPLLGNPYKAGTDEHRHWENGWMIAASVMVRHVQPRLALIEWLGKQR